jgi:hypothetical protein
MAAKRITIKTTKGEYVSAIQAVAGDATQAIATGSLTAVEDTQLNENTTTYRLYPYDLNATPVITQNVLDSSTPRIVSEQAFTLNNTGSAALLYYDDTRTIRVVAGESITLRVEAQQPTTLNVENGLPTLKQPSEELTFLWAKDGEPLTPANSELYNETPDKIIPEVNQLRLEGITARMAGTYTCDISNDIGTTTTEDITLEVLTPNLPRDPFFGINLIQNGFATDGMNGWTTTLGSFTSKKLMRGDLDVQARTPHTNVFGYSPNCIYPYPGNIITRGIRGLDYSQLLGKQGSYFAREGIDYAVNGGTQQAIMYQDIDLSDITDYISGKAYGAQGVRAYFSCIIGNAITRYIPTIDIVGPDERYNEDFYYSGAPRVSYENYVLAGFGVFEERVNVVVQEYENDTLLPSVQFGNTTYGGRVASDTLLDLYNTSNPEALSYLSNPIQPPFTDEFTTFDGATISLPTIVENPSMRTLNLYNAIYPTRPEFRYNYGQYADFKAFTFDRLNPRTNKIRVTLRIDNNTGRFVETDPIYTQQTMREFEPWRAPRYKLLLTEFNTKIRDIFNNNQSSKYKDKSLMEQIAPGDNSRAMATGFGLVLEPITKASGNLATFRNRILSIPTRVSSSAVPLAAIWTDNETRPVPPSPFSQNVSFRDAAQNFTGLSTILDILGPATVQTFRRFNQAAYYAYVVRPTENRDDNGLRGTLVVTNLATGAQLQTSEDYNSYPDNPNGPLTFDSAGGHVLSINYTAGNRNSWPSGERDNWQDELFPWVIVEIANPNGPFTAGGQSYWVSLWPEIVPIGYDSAKALTDYRIVLGSDGVATSSTGGGKRPRDLAESDGKYSRSFEVLLPSNQVKSIWAGVRHGNFNTEDTTVTAKVQFKNNQLVYYRTS